MFKLRQASQKMAVLLHKQAKVSYCLKLDLQQILENTTLFKQWCRQDFQLTGSEYCFYPQNLKNPMQP